MDIGGAATIGRKSLRNLKVGAQRRCWRSRWRLLTSHRIEKFEAALWIARLYRQRWTVEQLSRTVKTRGFDIERATIEAAPFLC
ncbi:MAG: hypothetical protein OXB95_13185 [Rhodobacteraceae bacterium]|nr:hypothetical protein [Paracoccaceae bacterium]